MPKKGVVQANPQHTRALIVYGNRGLGQSINIPETIKDFFTLARFRPHFLNPVDRSEGGGRGRIKIKGVPVKPLPAKPILLKNVALIS